MTRKIPKKVAKPVKAPSLISTAALADDEPLRQIGLEEFVRRLKTDTATGTNADKRFALFLGAGCSVSSGIPAAGALVKDHWIPRLRDYQAPQRSDSDAWAVEAIEGYDPKKPALSYGRLIDKLFHTADDRQREIENLCDGRTPSFGYAVLAQLVAQNTGRFNLVLTTNFDDLLADALYLYTDVRPLVIHHESLAAYIRPTRTRPLIVKLHGDHRLSPRNTALETGTLEQAIQQRTAMALHDRGIVFMGYSGEDVGILEMLKALPPEALPYGAYWVHPDQPQGAIRAWLTSRNGVWVRSGWFDEVMLTIRSIFALPHPEPERFNRIFRDYHDKFRELSESIESKPAGDADTQVLRKAISDTEASFPDFWRAISEAARVQQSDPSRADEIYRKAIDEFPDAAPLLGEYATFLYQQRKDPDAVAAMFKRAVYADVRNATNLGNYAYILDLQRKDLDMVEAMYKRALDTDPSHDNNLGNYANFLYERRKEFDVAEAVYKRALEADPKNANNLGNYATFLRSERKDFVAAEAMYKRALEADPKHANSLGNYANFLGNSRKDFDAAEAMYKRALEADPKHANSLGNYANFLCDSRKDFDAAEAMYRRALEADPKHANNLGNYANFLCDSRKDFDAAESMYKRALEADPKHANSLGNYANFLCNLRKDFDAAEAMYKRALEADPKHANSLGNYANFLCNSRKDFDAAEAMYKRALEVNSNHANNLANLAQLLLVGGKTGGLATLENALTLLRDNHSPVIEIECLFYLLAHGPAERSAEALRRIRALLESGTRSTGWDFSPNVESAQKDGHPHSAWLGRLAAVINGDSDADVLNEWPEWNAN